MREIDGRIFVGGLDTDSDPTAVEQGDYIDAADIINGYGGVVGVVVFPKGATAITYSMPLGTNRCLGTCEDKFNNRLLFFFWNSIGAHLIISWDPITNSVIQLAAGPELDFDESRRITHSFIVNGKILYWTDAVSYNGELEGKYQKMLDLDRGNPSKVHIFELYAGQPGEGQFANGNVYTFYISPILGLGAGDNFELTADGTYLNDPIGGMAWIKSELEAKWPTLLSIDDCGGCKLTITFIDLDSFFELIADEGDILLVPITDYPQTLKYQHLDLLKEPAHCAPTTKFVADPLYFANNVRAGCFQFIVRYIYYNGERSSWSPVSNVALNIGLDGEVIDGLNAIEVDLTDPRLSDPEWLCMIRHVEVAFRKNNFDNFFLIERIPVCELGILTQKLLFKNERAYSAVASDEAGAAGLQVLKPFDNLPLLAGTMSANADDEGNTIIFQGATLENLPPEECVEMSVEVEATTNECLIDIKGRVFVSNSTIFPDDTPNFDYYPLNGFVVYLAGTHYYAISDNPAGVAYPEATGEFTIRNVPRGKYVIRVASFRCEFGSSIAPRYDLNNGLEWQRTSSPISSQNDAPVDSGNCFISPVNPNPGAGFSDGRTEFLIDISDPGSVPGPVYDLVTEFTPGVISVSNQHHSKRSTDTGVNQVYLRELYVIDNDGLDDSDATRIGALNCERQEGNISGSDPQSPAFLTDYNYVTDHNGYVSLVRPAEDVVGSFIISLINSSAPALWRGDYGAMYGGTLTLMSGQTMTDPGVYFLVNKDPVFTARKCSLRVSAEDMNGAPVQGVVIIYTSTTRAVKTGLDGSGTIVIYAPSDSGTRTNDSLVLAYHNDNCYEFYPDPNPYAVSTNIDLVKDKTILPFVFDFVVGIAITSRALKGGGVYDLAIVYEDRGNRTGGVSKGVKLEMPYHTAPLGFIPRRVIWQIDSYPPEWATHYRIVRTKNSIHAYYVQWGIKSVLYARIPSQLEDPIITDYDNGDYTHIFLELYVPPATPSTGPYYLPFRQEDGQYAYQPAEGDFVRFILNEQGDPLTVGTVYMEAAVVGKYVDGNKSYAVIENLFGSTEVKANWLAEYYQPSPGVEEIYYEGGEDCYDILNPGLANRYHAGPLQNQTGAVPARGYLNMGDTYWRRDAFTGSSSVLTEHSSPHSIDISGCEDVGRAFVFDPDAKQIFFPNRVRFSGRYVVSSDVNGLSSYRALDFKDINRDHGIITSLVMANNVMLAICRYRVQPLYINRNTLMTLDGSTSVGRSNSLIEIADESVSPYGTHNPESIVVNGPHVYGWCKYRGVVWRYAANGVEDVVVKMVRYFRQRGVERLPVNGEVVLGGFDRVNMRYFISFIGSETLFGETISFDTVKGRWDCKHRFFPDAYGMVGQEMLTAKRVGFTHLWRHFKDPLYSNYHGIQRAPYITIPFNAAPRMNKLWWSMRVLSSKLFTATNIVVPASVDYASGMSSRLKAGRWHSYEGHWFADLLRDMNDTSKEFLDIVDVPTRQATALLSGRKLRGEVLIVTLTAASGAVDTKLRSVDVYYTPSKVTNP